MVRPNPSGDLGLGVKSQSSPGIAGSHRNWPQSSPRQVCQSCRETDWGFRGLTASAPSPTPNALATKA